MSRLRFATARALFEAFPEVAQKISVPPTDRSPIEFLNALSSTGKLPDAVTFCAYLLPRREAIWWACESVRTLAVDFARDDDAVGLLAAEAWVSQPDDDRRQAALDIGTRGDRNNALTWLALAAGWSGGFQVNGNKQTPLPACMTARAVRIAVLFSAARIAGTERLSGLRSCIAEGIRLAKSEEF
jgi:hypothetical protein